MRTIVDPQASEDARDLRQLYAELEQIILDADPDFRRRPALPKPGA